MQLFHQDTGTGPPLFILHGLFGASGNWRTLSRNVFGKAFTTVAVDLRNHGRSPHALTMSYPEMAQDVVDLMDALGYPSAHILGHSMGGKVAMQLALDHPDRVDRLVVADIAPKEYPPGHEAILDALCGTDPGQFAGRDDIDAALARSISSAGVRQFLMKNLERGPAGFSWKLNLPVIKDSYDLIRGSIDSWDAFNGPTLFVAGGASAYVSDADLPSIRALFPFAELTTLPGVGHWLHAEAPEAFSGIVVEFLGQMY